MLEELYLNNIVIFEKAVMNFSSGLNVISGETGAGKSLVATAIGLALGARANSDIIRSNTDSASISAIFSPLNIRAREILEQEVGVAADCSEGLIFERRISRSRASRMLIAGKPVTSNAAQIMADLLLDIAAQNEHTKLEDPAYQRFLLDSYGAVNTADYRELYSRASKILRRINSGNNELQQHKLELERIEYKLEKIEIFAPDPEFDRDIEERIELVAESENIRNVADEAAEYIYDGEDAVVGKLAHLLRNSSKYAGLSVKLQEATEMLENSCALLEDAARAYRGVAEDGDYSEAELDKMIERAEELKSLCRLLECGDSELSSFDAVLEEKKRLEQRLSELSLWEISTEELEKELLELQPQLVTEAGKITAARIKAGKKLAKIISKELKTLGMENADFIVEFTTDISGKDGIKDILAKSGAEGFEEVHFMIIPNVGEAPSSIAETASGGESSRAMLAIKSALAAVHAPDTLIFDEIDSGVGGRLGDVLGRKLYELSRDRQVIVITHLPQIAAYADTHLQVSKAVQGDRTLAKVRELNEKERVEEIAQMINGRAASETTREQAREMLAKREG